jgi:hypothetical protein
MTCHHHHHDPRPPVDVGETGRSRARARQPLAEIPRMVQSHLLPRRTNLHDVIAFVEAFTQNWADVRQRYAITRGDGGLPRHPRGLALPHARRSSRRGAWDVAHRHASQLLDSQELLIKAEVEPRLTPCPSSRGRPSMWGRPPTSRTTAST